MSAIWHQHCQARFPLATLLLVAETRPKAQQVRLFNLALEVARQRAETHAIPEL